MAILIRFFKKYAHLFSMLCFGILAVCTTAHATEDKLSVTVYVPDQSNQHRADAFKEAIDIAMGRITGQSSHDEPVHGHIRDFASRYIRGFRYLTKGKADIEARPIKGVRKLLLKVDFNTSMLRKALYDGDASVANTRLSAILFWVAESARGQRQIINAHQVSTTANAIKQYSAARGIRAILPEYNAKESLIVSATDISGGFDANIRRASRAYIVDKIVMLSLAQQADKSWRGTWTLLLSGAERSKWIAVGKNRTEAIRRGINTLQNSIHNTALTSDHAATGRHGLIIEIQNIRSLDDYASVEAYLKNLTAIKRVAPAVVKNDRTLFTLDLQSGQHVLESQILQNNILQQVLNSSLNIGQADVSGLSLQPDLTFIYKKGQ